MGNQYGFTGLTPALAIRREAYRKGKRSGWRAKVYDDASHDAARARFLAKYWFGEVLIDAWEEGWRDGGFYRNLS